jgi:HlyD family secretion protein
MRRGLVWFVAGLAMAACRADDDALTISGTVEIREVQLAPLAAGRLAVLLKDEGDTVESGDTVAVLEQPGLDALIRERRARAAAVTQRTAEIEAARADSLRAANDLARARQLLDRRIISEQQYDQLRNAAAAAAARLEAVRASSNEARAAEAALAGTLAIRDQLTLVAPAAGVILTRYAEPGEVLVAGTPVLALGLVRDPWIRAYVGERYLSRLALGQPVTVRVDGSEREFNGTITDIAPRAEFTPRAALTERERSDLVFAIKVAVSDDPDGRLKAGLPVTLRIALAP